MRTLTHVLSLSALFAISSTAVFAQTTPSVNKASLSYSSNRGVSADMTFNRNSSTYNIHTIFKIPLYSMQFVSNGSMRGNQMIPQSYSDTRRGKIYAKATFNHNNKTITYGKAGQSDTTEMRGIPMDLFSLAWQLSLNDGKLSGVSQFTNGKKVYNETTNIRANGSQTVTFKNQPLKVNMYRATRAGDVMEYGLAPSMGNVPAVIRYTDNGTTYQLNLSAATIDGKKY